jgi:hypothetical protein
MRKTTSFCILALLLSFLIVETVFTHAPPFLDSDEVAATVMAKDFFAHPATTKMAEFAKLLLTLRALVRSLDWPAYRSIHNHFMDWSEASDWPGSKPFTFFDEVSAQQSRSSSFS